MLLSIIIPAYNASSTIGRCLDSVLCQTFEDFEIIVVNDGSKDDTGEICYRYAEKDARIRVIDKENEGVSSARNTGINAARGKYIQFIDADDYIAPDMCQLLVEKMCTTGSDLVMCGFVREYFLNNRMCGCERRDYPGCDISCVKELGKHFGVLYEKMLISALWNKLYKIDLINENKLKMPINMSLGEDLIFNLDYISLCQTISIIEQCPYHYTCSERDSLTGGYSGITEDNSLIIYHVVKHFCISNTFFEENRCKISKLLLRTQFRRIQNCRKNSGYSAMKKLIFEMLQKPEINEACIHYTYNDPEMLVYQLMIRLKSIFIIEVFSIIRPLLKQIMIHKKDIN